MVDRIPGSLAELTPAWLTDVLRESDRSSPDVVVGEVQLTVLGTGEGFAGELARLVPVYERGDGPTSLVAKIPTSIDDNRDGSELLNVYERELRVYEELLPGLDVPAPALVHGAIEPNPVDVDKQMRMLRRLDRLPVWLLRLLVRMLQRFARQTRRRSVMLVEDLAPATVGDQVTGCDVDAAGRVLEVAARLHAATWGERAPRASTWLQRSDVAPRFFHAGFLDARKDFLARGEGILSPHTLTLVERMRKEGPTHLRKVHDTMPLCVLHGDLRLDNLFFAADGSVRALIDWQLTNLGPAMIDVAYFLTGSVAPSVTEHEIDGLLARYHDALERHGVRDYPLERVRRDYDTTLLLILHRMASLASVEFGDARGVALVDRWLARLDARVAHLPA